MMHRPDRWLRAAIVGLALAASPAAAETEPGDFARNVTTHVLIHELAHALIREFDLPVLGNEEIIADAFATLYIAQVMPDRAKAIVTDRARSWIIEAAEFPGTPDLKGEHPPDARRAYRAVCLLYGFDPESYGDLPSWAGLSDNDAADCADAAPEIARSWRRLLTPLMAPDEFETREFRIEYGDSDLTDMVRESGLMEEIGGEISRFDWHSQITLFFDGCDGGAGWSRSRRTIRLCDSYLQRFIDQEEAAALLEDGLR
ncbi:DUF4344 domain-containing metallopeptidase [Aestuariibius insulae]|uniref:DUF4344 domain-containing metallopeptidase n=1 Tax=Aestuariibius insulae TaxID=2058287 RepID=UPI00345E7918